jgi:hypothetical protein
MYKLFFKQTKKCGKSLFSPIKKQCSAMIMATDVLDNPLLSNLKNLFLVVRCVFETLFYRWVMMREIQ